MRSLKNEQMGSCLKFLKIAAAVVFFATIVCGPIFGSSDQTLRCESLLGRFPYPNHIPDFGSLIFKGHAISKGQKITFMGEPRTIHDHSREFSVYEKPASVGYWTRYSGDDLWLIMLQFEKYGPWRPVPVTEVLKSPEVKETYSADLIDIKEREFEDRDYILIDKIKDPYSQGYIYRAKIEESVKTYAEANNSGGLPIYKFAKYFRLARKLGFEIDEKNDILYYPDNVSFSERLSQVYKEWGVEEGVLPKEVNGEIPGKEWIELIIRENRIGQSGIHNYVIHWHDLETHTLGWIAAVEAVKILRERLIFLSHALSVAEKYPDGSNLLPDLNNWMVYREGYDLLETGLPDPRDVAGLLESDTRDRRLENIKRSILSIGGKSANDIKLELLSKIPSNEPLREAIAAIPVSHEKIDSGNIDQIMERISQRFR